MTTESLEIRACGHRFEADVPFAECPRCLLDFALSPQEPDPIPDFIGPYKIRELLGSGAMGAVYLAQQPVANAKVAVKTIQSDGYLDDAMREQFKREIEILGQLRHQNIIKIYDGTGLEADPPYFVMEWIDGGSLDNEAQRSRFCDSASAARVMLRVAEAVQCAHESSVFHRDLKPANILIDEHGNPRVSDFGVAKLVDRDAPEVAATFAGTLSYMSPEQAGFVEAPVAAASDVYALGASLYFLLTGKHPYEASSRDELKRCFENGLPAKPSSVVPSIHPDLERVCMTALAHSLDDRYRTASDFARDLKRVLERRPPEPPNQPVTRWRKLRSAIQRHPFFSAVAVLGALLLATDLAAFALAYSQQTFVQDSLLSSNALLARVQARALLAIFEIEAQALVRAAGNPAVDALFDAEHPVNPAPALHQLTPTFDTVFMLNPNAKVIARWPWSPPEDYKKLFPYRDYFIGSAALQGGDVYLSRAFHSKFKDDNLKFALSTPIRHQNGELKGVFVGSYAATDAYRGHRKVPFKDRIGSDQIIAVLGPREAVPEAKRGPTPYTVVLHPELKESGKEYRVSSELSSELQRRFPRNNGKLDFIQPDIDPYSLKDYADPILHGTWLAAIAPIGNTGYAVVAQTRAQASDKYTASTVAPYLATLSLCFLLIVATAAYVTFGRRKNWKASEFD